MALPIPPVSPGSAVNTARTLIRAFTGVLHARRTSRPSFFEGMVKKQYGRLGDVHRAFHDLLVPLDQALGAVELDLAKGGAAWAKLDKLSEVLGQLQTLRSKGQPDRLELVAHCQVVASSIVLPSGSGRALAQREREQVRQLMGAICAYFSSNEEYQHDFGNALGALEGMVSAWRSGHLQLTPKSVGQYRAALQNTRQAMAQKWVRASALFAEIRVNLEFEVFLGTASCVGVLEEDRRRNLSAA